ncbi:MAG: HAMP domain-containing histidine kinase [Halobacteriales archaeon]|nr:HAMP domain-containing histidine kinase [Halobacteriales archaeon]
MSPADSLRAAILFVGWPGMALVAAFVLWRTVRFHQQVKGSAFGNLVLFTVVGWTLTMAFLAFFATLLLQQDPTGAGPLAAGFLTLWVGTMAAIVWIVQRWGDEAVHINLYYAELAAMDRVKTQLIDTVAHELNTPLTPILLKFDLLRKGRFGPTTPQQAEAIASIERNLGRLQVLVDHVVLATQMQTGQLLLAPGPVEAGAWLRGLAAAFEAQAREEGRELAVRAAEGEVEVDRRRMDQVVRFLLHNAFRYSEKGAPVTLESDLDQEGLTVTVRDAGRGFTPEQAGLLFQPFRHLRGHDQDVLAGMGLSLYLAKGLVDAHGGRLSAASEGLGHGATFAVWVPRRWTPPAPPPRAAP